MDADNRRQTLIVEEDELEIVPTSSEIRTFPAVDGLTNHVSENCKSIDVFNAYVPGRYILQTIESDVWRYSQMKHITFFFDSISDMTRAKQIFGKSYRTFFFCLKNEVANRVQNNHTLFDLISQVPDSQKSLKSIIEARRKQAQMKQQNLLMHGFNAGNINDIGQRFRCPACLLILRDPVQLNCGHRLCQSCLDNWKEDPVICLECGEQTSKKEALLDKGFRNDMKNLHIVCSCCNWNSQLRDYQSHLDQCHPTAICEYCDEVFISSEHLRTHQNVFCDMILIPCHLQAFGCSHTVQRADMENHYLTEEHQLAIIEIIRRTSNSGLDLQPDDQSPLILNETIKILAGGLRTLTEDMQTISDEIPRSQGLQDIFTRKCTLLGSAFDQQNERLKEFEHQLQILQQNIHSLRKENDDGLWTSYDGTLAWKITNVNERISKIRSHFYEVSVKHRPGHIETGNRTSIFSPPFYSSHTGYKMCASLSLSNDGNPRRTYVSLFFLLMRGKHDAVLEWPFHYKVVFCLCDQSGHQQHIIDSFRPDIRSNSFQRPKTDMNIASGIPKFCSLACIINDNNPYVRDDAMFIRIVIDFDHIPEDLLPYIFVLNPAIPTHRQFEMIREKATRSSPHPETTDA